MIMENNCNKLSRYNDNLNRLNELVKPDSILSYFKTLFNLVNKYISTPKCIILKSIFTIELRTVYSAVKIYTYCDC